MIDFHALCENELLCGFMLRKIFTMTENKRGSCSLDFVSKNWHPNFEFFNFLNTEKTIQFSIVELFKF